MSLLTYLSSLAPEPWDAATFIECVRGIPAKPTLGSSANTGSKFWDDVSKRHLTQLLCLWRTLYPDRAPSVGDITRLAADNAELLNALTQLRAHTDSGDDELATLLRYFEADWGCADTKTRACVLATLTDAFSNLHIDDSLHSVFGVSSTSDLEDMARSGILYTRLTSSQPVFFISDMREPDSTWAQFSIRDLRFYQQMGLFPDTVREGRNNLYYAHHLLRLVYVQVLRSQGLKQKAAVTQAAPLTLNELTQLLHQDKPVGFKSEAQAPDREPVLIRKANLAAWFIPDDSASCAVLITKDGSPKFLFDLQEIDAHTLQASQLPQSFDPTGPYRLTGTLTLQIASVLALCRKRNYALTVEFSHSLVLIPLDAGQELWGAYRLGLQQEFVIRNQRFVFASVSPEVVLPKLTFAWEQEHPYYTFATTPQIWERPCNLALSVTKRPTHYQLLINDATGSTSFCIYTPSYPYDTLRQVMDAYTRYRCFTLKATRDISIRRFCYSTRAYPDTELTDAPALALEGWLHVRNAQQEDIYYPSRLAVNAPLFIAPVEAQSRALRSFVTTNFDCDLWLRTWLTRKECPESKLAQVLGPYPHSAFTPDEFITEQGIRLAFNPQALKIYAESKGPVPPAHRGLSGEVAEFTEEWIGLAPQPHHGSSKSVTLSQPLRPNVTKVYSPIDLVLHSDTPLFGELLPMDEAPVIVSASQITVNCVLPSNTLLVAPKVLILCAQEHVLRVRTNTLLVLSPWRHLQLHNPFCNVYHAWTPSDDYSMSQRQWKAQHWVGMARQLDRARTELPQGARLTTEACGYSRWHLLAVGLDTHPAAFIESFGTTTPAQLAEDAQEYMSTFQALSPTVEPALLGLPGLSWEEFCLLTAYRNTKELVQLYGQSFLLNPPKEVKAVLD